MGERVRGLGVSPGIAVGRAFLLHVEPLPVVAEPVPATGVDEEIRRFERARELAIGELEELRRRVAEALGERYAGIFQAQKLVLGDPLLVSRTIERIRGGRVSARWALKEVVDEFLLRFASVRNDYLRERGGELADVQRRLQRLLRGEPARARDLPDGPLVVVAGSIDPSDAVLLAGRQVAGLATDAGGRTSHTAILAQALSLPAVIGLHDLSRRVQAGEPILLDGDSGEVILAPSPEELGQGHRSREAGLAREREMVRDRDLPATTLDGVELAIRANIEFPREVEQALRFGARGIGLYRSEFLLLSRAPDLPDEEDHFRTYVEMAREVAPHPAVIRTLDLGGDKYPQDTGSREEPNPVLGLRGVRFSLEHPEIFRPQLRGLLRAAAVQPNVRMLLPLVTSGDEIRAVRRLLAAEVVQLAREAIPAAGGLPLGIMIEVPAAALAADILAREADFFSIGTNDLIQYGLAVDRSNEALDHLYQPLHPGLLRMLRLVVDGARSQAIPVAICGEMATDPRAVELLVGLGLREFSVHPRAVAAVRAAVRHLNTREAARHALAALEPAALEPDETKPDRLPPTVQGV